MSSENGPRWRAATVLALAAELREYGIHMESQEALLTGAKIAYRQATSEIEQARINREICTIRANISRLRRQVEQSLGRR